ncbi:MAG: sodium:proton antiporter, partial [Candidatus Aminicenantes bacterium]|nr:sodium:proton antiporter [Candidatus Aminicenantes bacterium]
MLKKAAILFFILFIAGSFFLVPQEHHDGETATTEHGEIVQTEHGDSHGHSSHGNIGKELPIWSAVPFVGILLSIALFPLLAPKFWHHNFGKISFFWAIAFSLPFLIFYKSAAFYEIMHIYLIDYIPFIILLWALYTVSGGILLKGSIKGTPLSNLVILLIGTLLSSWIGTTGSAMLLIRPIIRANAHRKNKVHIVIFFIFLVANIGGSLTPLGDPPLFLGFLHGVSFFWTLKLIPHMAFVSVILLGVFFLLDTFYYKKEEVPSENVVEKDKKREPIRLIGTLNFLFLLGIIIGVLFSGSVKLGETTIFGVHVAYQNLARDFFLVLMGILSLIFTKKALRKENNFTWFPIQEVAILFAGIFMTIIPALAMLKSGSSGPLGFIVAAVKEPWQYFWVTGGLSSFLDNAPTYLTFFNTALGQFFPGQPESVAVV